MDKNELDRQYEASTKTTSFGEHQRFIKQLLASNDPEVIDYHFSLLGNRQNRNLYQRLRAAFAKRGAPAAQYLIKRAAAETNPQLLGDILHLLGVMKVPEAVPLARKLAGARDPELRDKAVYVLGWLGTESDVDILADRLLNDPNPKVRMDAATAHDQMRMRLPDTTNRLLANLKSALAQETDEEVLAWIIITIQYFLKKKFGLKENIEEATYSGDVQKARLKARDVLTKFNM
jgi:HEAT repeat protein